MQKLFCPTAEQQRYIEEVMGEPMSAMGGPTFNFDDMEEGEFGEGTDKDATDELQNISIPHNCEKCDDKEEVDLDLD